MAILRPVVRRLIKGGVSWQHPVLNLLVHALDPIDAVARRVRRLEHLPPYSARVRSSGIPGEFGGQRFARQGEVLAGVLQSAAGLKKGSRVLEIGCGCGTTAIALARILEDGGYTGMDVDAKSIGACRRNRFLSGKGFNYDLLDVYHRMYNQNGRHQATSFRFPYLDESFDVIFLISVFTHLLSDDISNYIAEMSRMIKPDGRCLFSTFLVDYGRQGDGVSFPLKEGPCYFYNQSLPEIAVGYELGFFVDQFARRGMELKSRLLGSWRVGAAVEPESGYSQDILVFSK